jgi:phosphohistidine phosphatase
MNLFLLRHANADWPDWNKADDKRPLTKRGKKESRQMARFLERTKASIELVVTSPLPRASQTAKIVAHKLKTELREDQKLAPGFNATKLRALLKGYADRDLMIAGHEPDFSEVVRALTGGAIKLAKAGIAVVQLEPGTMRGRLLWLISPREVKRSSAES